MPSAGDALGNALMRPGRGEDPSPAPARQQPCQRGEPHPVDRLVPYPAGVPAQHRVLMPEHEQLGILSPVTAEHQDSQAEYPARQLIDDLEQHPASQPSLQSSCRQTAQVTTQSSNRAAHGDNVDLAGIARAAGSEGEFASVGPCGPTRPCGGARPRSRPCTGKRDSPPPHGRLPAWSKPRQYRVTARLHFPGIPGHCLGQIPGPPSALTVQPVPRHPG